MVETRTLASLLASVGRFQPAYAAFIVIRCCHRLAHTDPRRLSPSRIQVASDGDVTIADLDPGAREFGYLSPELASGQLPDAMWSHIEPRAAVFMLGSILWEMLAGRPLFKGATDYKTIELVRSAQVPPLPDVPAELEAIVRKALARDVDSRYQTPGDLASALAAYLRLHAPN